MSPVTPPDDDRRRGRSALSRELGELLIELSIGVHRYAMYPPGHPSLDSISENVITRLADYFIDRTSLTIGVAQHQLVIEGVATDSGHPVLRDLARRLHGHQLGALTLGKGVVAREVEELLADLARDSEHETPLGLLPDAALPSWEHVSLHPIGYDHLAMQANEEPGGDEPDDRAVALWLGLAQTAMAAEEPYHPADAPEPEVLAKTIRSHRKERAYDQVIVGYLLQLAEELKGRTGGEAGRVRERVSGLIDELDDRTLGRLVELGGDSSRRKRFVLDANQTLAVDAVMKVLRAAAAASGQEISTSLVRLLAKLSDQARAGRPLVRSQADSALRENVEDLLEDWELEDPNPGDYTQILDSIARSAPIFERAPEEEGKEAETGGESGANRLLQMALEVEAWGPTARSAVSELLDGGQVSRVLELASRVGPDSPTARAIRDYVTDPSQVRRLLEGDDVDERALETIVGQMGAAAVPPLMDALVESESRAVRRKVFDRLSELDEEELAPRIMERLQDPRWYVVRNMLALLQRLESPPEGFDPMAFLDDPDRRVRREAFPLVLADRGSRIRGLAAGLADEDERLVRMALLELKTGVPETLVPTLVSRVIRGERPEGLRSAAIRALRSSDSTLARETLVDVVDGGKSLLGKQRVAEKSESVLAALECLALEWADDPAVADLLRVARKHRDPEVREAAEAEGRRVL